MSSADGSNDLLRECPLKSPPPFLSTNTPFILTPTRASARYNSSILFAPKLKMESKSSSVRLVTSSTTRIPSLSRVLQLRTEISSWLRGISRASDDRALAVFMYQILKRERLELVPTTTTMHLTTLCFFQSTDSLLLLRLSNFLCSRIHCTECLKSS